MPFIGNKPAQVPLTSADIADSIITSAKIVDGTIVNADINASAGLVFTKLASTGTLTVDNIQFPATAVASANANNLDDYEEGTWTPVVSAGSINGAGKVYTGGYTKIGRLVQISFNATSTDQNLQVTSYVAFSGLPFTSVTNGTSTVTTEDIDAFARQGFSVVYGNSTTFYLSTCGSAGSTNQLTASLTYTI
jgi:hypothetical protein